MKDKLTTREYIKNCKKNLTEIDLQNAYKKIFIKWNAFWNLIQDPLFFQNKKIGLYSPMKNEAYLNDFYSFFISQKASLFFPKIINPQKAEMAFIDTSPYEKSRWESGPFNIQEPILETNSIIIEIPEDFFILFVPSVAVHTQGHRLGMGKGYYDRFLSLKDQNSGSPLKIACIMDFQLLSDFSIDPWDHSIDWVITEKREIKFQGFYDWCKRYKIRTGSSQ